MAPYKFEYMKFYDDLETISRPYSKINDPISRDFLLKIREIFKSEKGKWGMAISVGKENGLVKELSLGTHDENFSPEFYQKLQPLLHEIPKYLPHLLILSIRINKWKSIPSEFAELTELIEFSIGGNELSSIPPNLFDNMKNLKFIGYMGAKMTEIPSLTNNSFASLEDLSISNCHYLKKIPALDALVNLRWLEIKNSAIESLPDNIGDCYHLEEIKLTACPNLRKLPESISKLTSLRKFRIYECGLEELPKSLFKQPNPPIIPMNIWYCPICTTLTQEMRIELPPSIYVDPLHIPKSKLNSPLSESELDEPDIRSIAELEHVGHEDMTEAERDAWWNYISNFKIDDIKSKSYDDMTTTERDAWDSYIDKIDDEEKKKIENCLAYQTFMDFYKLVRDGELQMKKEKEEREKAKLKEEKENQENNVKEAREKEKKEEEKKSWTKIKIEEG